MIDSNMIAAIGKEWFWREGFSDVFEGCMNSGYLDNKLGCENNDVNTEQF